MGILLIISNKNNNFNYEILYKCLEALKHFYKQILSYSFPKITVFYENFTT